MEGGIGRYQDDPFLPDLDVLHDGAAKRGQNPGGRPVMLEEEQ